MSEIAYKKDIIDKISSNNNIDKEKVEHLIDFVIKDLKELCSKKDTLAVSLPFLSSMYVSYPKIKKVHSDLKLLYKKKLLSSKKGNKYHYHFRTSKIKSSFYTKNLNITQLQEFQNEEEG